MRRLPAGLLIASLFATAGCQEAASPVAVLASGERGVTSIAVDDGFVYWSKADGTIKRISLDTGAIETIATVQGSPKNLTLDDGDVYFSAESTLSRVSKRGGALELHAATAPIQAISLDRESVYWTAFNEADAESNPGAGSVNKVGKDLAVAETLVPGAARPRGILAGAANVFWTTTALDASVKQVPFDGGAITAVLPPEDQAGSLAMDRDHLFSASIGDGRTGTISMAALDGSNRRVLASGEETLVQVMTDSNNVYWSNGIGEVRSISVFGGDPVSLVSGPHGPVRIAMDATTVYWANAAGEAILAMPKL